MKSFLQILMESDRQYHFRIKSLFDLNEYKTHLEEYLSKYELRTFTAIKKLPFQANPLDFYGCDAGDVWMVDVVVAVPITSFLLHQELVKHLGVADKYLRVLSDNDPLEIENQRLAAYDEISQMADGLEKAPLLSTDSQYPEAKDLVSGSELFGNTYNTKFLTALAQVSAENQPEVKKSQLFDYLDNVRDFETAEDFNADIDTPKPVPWWEVKTVKEEPNPMISQVGNYDNDKVTYRERFMKDGKEVDISVTTNPIRK